MADTLEIGRSAEAERPPQQPPERAVRPLPMRAAARWPGLAASIAEALEQRRLFVLLPFAMVAGLVLSVTLPAAEPAVLAVAGVVLALALVVARATLPVVRLLTILAAVWAGLCLLPIHGALFGTTMLTRAAYGTYQARVDEIVEATPAEQRVVLSGITPTGTDRTLPIRRARVLVKGGPMLAPG